MENKKKLNIIKNAGINQNNLTGEDIIKLIELHLTNKIDKEDLKEFLKESNVTYKTFIEGLGVFVDIHKESSNKYIESLDYRLKDLIKQAENAETEELKEKLDKKIDSILNRLKEEADANRTHFQKTLIVTAGLGASVIGGAIFLATRNPELFKKGVEMIAQESIKRIV
ncbi:hypothetical protein PGC35_14395 [Psychrobacillus sp. PGGUH221]|uniref:hypothetical protein n=1 Tax=Psychrobacillus sp. PGGUH221 TaxID=3020058 RepID=UPI0035C72D71